MMFLSSLKKLKQKNFFIIWGSIDLLCIIWYCANNLGSHQLPYVYDFEDLQMYWHHTYLPQEWLYLERALLTAFGIFNLSIVISCALFFSNKILVKYFVYAQVPLRLGILLVAGFGILGTKALVEQFAILLIILLFVTIEILRLRYAWKLKA